MKAENGIDPEYAKIEVVGIPGSKEFDTKEEAVEYAIDRVQEGWITHWHPSVKTGEWQDGFFSSRGFTVNWWSQ